MRQSATTSCRFLEKVNRAGGKLPLKDTVTSSYFNEAVSEVDANAIELKQNKRIDGNPKN
eukprot:CAMPEP_0185619050 /NCGR_PEP_ID=MMETSP0436-20130131/49238_1 /TAXON_ID=626734 ORGANISM="Favella taraikaensis, Strain Fe Narragansett Bay" /NCGR_SAMPLE_ID=MMETSP0436 /ASSEMBLY_ACC=CAM_ASM_000390 /LENGTH=59 /DNA_ID=CAMNT_0028258173 /DNA_START=400 /DNA_END=579 /DNA_ORIENTATION=+